MKRILIFICTFLIFPFIVQANDDVLTIENMSTYVVINNNINYSKEDKFKTKIIFGEEPSTDGFVLKIPKGVEYTKNNSSKRYKYKINNTFYGLADEDNEHTFTLESDDNYDIVKVGREAELLHEDEEFAIRYNVQFDSYNSNKYNLILADSKYNIDNMNFEIVLPNKVDNLKYLFSIDGKNFKENLEGIEYNISYGKIIGSYSKKIDAGDTLYFRMVYTDKKISNIILYGILGFTFLFCIYIFIKHLKKLN